jgi:hypothetical protein
MDDDREWKRLFGGSKRPAAKGPCPSPEELARGAEGPTPADAVAHLAECRSCREDLLVFRRQRTQTGKTERIPGDLRTRLHRLQAPLLPRRLLFAVPAAAAILIVYAIFVLLRPAEPPPVAVAPPKPSPRPVTPEFRPELPPPPPEAPKPTPRPEPPAPAPLPEKAPAPPPPAPVPPVVATPVPAPEKPAPAVPAPAPEKAAPEPTRAALKGTLAAIAGSCSVQTEGDAAAVALKPGQKHEFPGTIRLKAETAAAKISGGPVTYYVQRGAELAIQLQEGRTHVQLLHGEAFFDVVPANGLFEVGSFQARVTVRGTRFLVSSEKSETEVVVQRGAVELAAAGQAVSLAPGEHSGAAAGKAPSPAQKVDLARRLAWVRGLEEFLWIEAEQMAPQGGMVVVADPTASGGRAIGIKDPPKAGAEASAELRAKRRQPAPYAVWIRFSWPHNVPSSLSLSVGDALRWTSKDVAPAPGWQWVRAGAVELPDEPFRLRLADTRAGMKIDQLLLTTDLEFNPDTDKR